MLASDMAGNLVQPAAITHPTEVHISHAFTALAAGVRRVILFIASKTTAAGQMVGRLGLEPRTYGLKD
ncbi:hypothetical protein ABT061_23465 [Streptosporangium sp. NPDC002544]|uniref:hypothetical protein n=1 Tax=Streptosporangium sp. NPDC002544 TaxID=3154538 RepID=UPI0033338EE5